jgi:hypothetical protein
MHRLIYLLARVFLIASVALFGYCCILTVSWAPEAWVLAVIVIGIRSFKTRRQEMTSHGTARWATLKEIPQCENGLLIGYVVEY